MWKDGDILYSSYIGSLIKIKYTIPDGIGYYYSTIDDLTGLNFFFARVSIMNDSCRLASKIDRLLYV